MKQNSCHKYLLYTEFNNRNSLIQINIKGYIENMLQKNPDNMQHYHFQNG